MIRNEFAKKHLSALMGTTVGQIRINKAVAHIEHFECAAWHEASGTDVGGVYDLVLVEGLLYPYEVRLEAKVPATITSDNFQSLFGGVPCGSAYDSAQNRGKEAKPIRVSVELAKGISRTGISPGGWDQDVYVDPRTWGAVAEYFLAELEERVRWVAELSAGGVTNEVSGIGHAGKEIMGFAARLEEVRRSIQGLRTDDVWEQNTAWAKQGAK